MQKFKIRWHNLLVFSFPIFLNSFLARNTLVPNENWYIEWANYVLHGSSIYKDFYVPFPPLYIFFNLTNLLLPDPLLTSHLISLLVIGLMALGLFNLASLFFNTTSSLTSSLACTLLWSIHPTDLIAGYYEFAIMLATWSCYFYVKYWRRSVSLRYVILLSLTSLPSLVKQNFLILWLVLFAYFILRTMTTEAGVIRIKKMIFGTISMTFFYLAFAIYLIYTKSFQNFVSIMLEGGGKDPNINTLFINIFINYLRPANLMLMLFSGLGLFIWCQSTAKIMSKGDILSAKNVFLNLLGLLSIYIGYRFYSFGLEIPTATSIVISVGVITGILYLLYFAARNDSKIKTYPIVIIYSSIIIVLFIFDFSINFFDYYRDIFIQNKRIMELTFNLWNLASNFLWNITFTWIILMSLSILIGPIYRVAKAQENLNSKYLGLKTQLKQLKEKLPIKNVDIFVPVFVGILGSDLLNAFNGGMFIDGSVILGTFAVSSLLGLKIKSQILRNYRGILILFLSSVLFFSSISMVNIVYRWYFWNEIRTATTSSQLEIFRNFDLTTAQSNLYAEINEVLINSGFNRKASLISLPAQPTISNIISNDWNLRYKVYCPVLWVDICSEKAAQKTVTQILNNPPDYLIYFSLPDVSLLSLEKGFRAGKYSSLRYLQDQLKAESVFQKVGEIKAEELGESKVEIYKKRTKVELINRTKLI